jgi:hypothetical protein
LHVRSPGLTRRLAAVLAFALLHGCGTGSTPSTPPVPPAAAPASGEPELAAARAAPDVALCANRPRCVLAATRAIEGLPGAKLLTLRIADVADPSAEERCDRREYWLVRQSRDVLISADCEAQWGADSQGPAELQLAAGRLTIRYVEYQANDTCEVVDATIDLSSVTIERHSRQEGRVAQDRCQALVASSAPLPPAGDGTPAQPLLVLHRL